MGFHMIDTQNSQLIFKKYAHFPLLPASNMKLLPSIVALELLGPEYRFESTLSVKNEPKNYYEINSPIIFYSNGNPSFVSEDLFSLIKTLSLRGVKRIKGDLIIDASYFNPAISYPAGNDNKSNAYNALTTSTAINFNALEINIHPAYYINTPCNIEVYPPSPSIRIINRTKTVSFTTNNRISIKRTNTPKPQDMFIAEGKMSLHSAHKTIYRYTEEPLEYLANAVIYFLRKANIQWTGRIKINKDSKIQNTFPLVTAKSKNLGEIIRDMNKYSTNFIANQLLRVVHAESISSPPKQGNAAGGVAILKDFLSQLKIPSSEYVIIDGSGLSYDNRLSAFSIVSILKHAFRQFSYSSEFIASLPIFGIDGTLKDRGSSYYNLHRYIRAKTGSIKNFPPVSQNLKNSISISGYLHTGKTYAFSFIINNFLPKDYKKIKNIQDRILLEISNVLKTRGEG